MNWKDQREEWYQIDGNKIRKKSGLTPRELGRLLLIFFPIIVIGAIIIVFTVASILDPNGALLVADIIIVGGILIGTEVIIVLIFVIRKLVNRK